MASAALAGVRWRRPQLDGVDAGLRCAKVVHGIHKLGGVRVRAVAGYALKAVACDSTRGRVCRVPLFRTSFPRREKVLVSAMGQGEHDITDMQETDNVSGEWWKSVLTAVHDWSSDKLLGLAELADGSLFFSFGGSDSARPAAKPSAKPRAQGETKVKRSTTHNLTPTTRPQRQPSRFRKHSPIPASRKKETAAQEQAVTTAAAQPQAEDKKPQKGKSKPAKPPRPSSSFFKRSPIPMDRASVSALTSKKKSPSSEAAPAVKTPTKEAPAKTSPAKATPTKATPAKTAPAKATPAKAAVDPEQDSPFSPALKEILNHGKETAGRQTKDTPKSMSTDAKSSSAAPAKKTLSKPASEESEKVQTIDNGAVSKDLGSYKLPELRSLAKARGLKGYSKLKKGELVDLLASSES